MLTRLKSRVNPDDNPEEQEEKFSVPVAVSRVRTAEMRETLLLYGTIYPEKEVNIFSTVTGKVKQILAREGDRVRKDQVLAEIDRDQAGLKFAVAEVTSTIDGIVKTVMTQEGAMVGPTAPLFQIVDMDAVEVVVNIPEKQIARIWKGMGAELRVVSYPDGIFYGSVYKLSPVVDPVSRTLEARILVQNSHFLLKPGMFAAARITVRRLNEAVVIPLTALVDKEEGQVAFIVRDSKAHKVEPEIIFTEGDLAVIGNGIEVGDLIVVVGQQNLNEGDAVTISEEIE